MVNSPPRMVLRGTQSTCKGPKRRVVKIPPWNRWSHDSSVVFFTKWKYVILWPNINIQSQGYPAVCCQKGKRLLFLWLLLLIDLMFVDVGLQKLFVFAEFSMYTFSQICCETITHQCLPFSTDCTWSRLLLLYNVPNVMYHQTSCFVYWLLLFSPHLQNDPKKAKHLFDLAELKQLYSGLERCERRTNKFSCNVLLIYGLSTLIADMQLTGRLT